MGKADIIYTVREIVSDSKLADMLVQMHDFDPQKFLFFYSWFIQRDYEAGKKTRTELVQGFVDMYSMFPYCDDIRAWFTTKIPNRLIVQYRGAGIPLVDAEEMFYAGKVSESEIDEYADILQAEVDDATVDTP